jgi:prophage regulatory protein
VVVEGAQAAYAVQLDFDGVARRRPCGAPCRMETHTIAPQTNHQTILRLPAVTARVGVSSTSIWRWYRAGRFPKPRRLGAGSVGWLASEVDEWIQSRAVTGDAGAASRALGEAK